MIIKRIPQLIKRPQEMFAVGLKYVSPDLEEGQFITNCEVSISPNDSSGLKISGSPIIDGDTVSQIVYDGIDNEEYYVTFQVTTSGGHIYEDSIFVKVRELE